MGTGIDSHHPKLQPTRQDRFPVTYRNPQRSRFSGSKTDLHNLGLSLELHPSSRCICRSPRRILCSRRRQRAHAGGLHAPCVWLPIPVLFSWVATEKRCMKLLRTHWMASTNLSLNSSKISTDTTLTKPSNAHMGFL